MAEAIGALRAELSATAAQFERDMVRAAKAVGISKEAFRQMEQAAKIASLTVASMVSVFSAAGASVFAMTKLVANQGDELYKLSQKVGVSVEELSSLKLAAQLSDVTLEQLGTSLGKLARNMDEARSGTGEAADAFRRLGIGVEVGGKIRPLNAVLADLADRFSRMPDGAEKTALAMATLGKSGAEMIPLLNAGTAGLAAMQAEAERLGITWSTTSAKAAEEFNDSLTTLWKAFQGLQQTVFTDLMPTFTAFARQLTDLATSQEVRIWARDLGKAFIEIAQATKEWLQWLNLIPLSPADRIQKMRDEIARLNEEWEKQPAGTKWLNSVFGHEEQYRKRIADLEEMIRLAEMARGGAGAVRPGTPTLPDTTPFVPLGAGDNKLLEQDQKGWVAHAEAIIDQNFREAQALAKIAEEFWRDRDATQKAALEQEVANELESLRVLEEAWRFTGAGIAEAWKEREEIQKALLEQETANALESLKVEEEAWKYYFDYIKDEYERTSAAIAQDVEAIMAPLSRALKGAVQGILEGTQTLEEGFRRMGQNIAAALMETVIDTGLKEISKALVKFAQSMSSSGGSSWGGIISVLGQVFGSVAGARAAGGPVNAGSAYLVGERGPELFVPNTGGEIVANGAMGGTNVYVDARKAERGVSVEIMQAIRSGMGQAVNVSVARVQDLSRRGGMRGVGR